MTRKMKDSGIEWINMIPENWSVARLKQVFLLRKGLSITKDNLLEKGVKVISYGQIHSKDNTGVCISDSLVRYVGEEYLEIANECLVKKNDFIFADTSEDLDGAGNCVYIDLDEDIFAGYHTIILTPINNQLMDEWKYFAYLYKTDCWRSQLRSRVSGIKLYSITQKILKQTEVIIPDIKEQKKIVNYLDKKCTQIDQTIEKEKQLIEKLKEYKQSVITEAVTKGLNPNAKMKDSGVEWIGEIPEHWQTRRLKYEFRIKKNIAGKEGYDILSVTQNGIKIKDISKNEGQLAMDYSKYQLVDIDDFIMNHMDLLTGFVDCSKYRGVTSPDYRVFYLMDSSKDKNYYNYIFQSCYKNKIFYSLGQGVSFLGRWRIQTDKFLNFNIPVPPNEEQKEIADYLDKKCSSIDKLISNKEKLIEKLKEYKKSLIYECVTGKREV